MSWVFMNHSFSLFYVSLVNYAPLVGEILPVGEVHKSVGAYKSFIRCFIVDGR